MELRQKTELRRLLVPQLTQSLHILALPLLEIRQLVQEELLANPTIEEVPLEELPNQDFSRRQATLSEEMDEEVDFAGNAPSLYDVLITQLNISATTAEELCVGQEIIEHIDENGYLRTPPAEIAANLGKDPALVMQILETIRQFEPPGVGACTTAECLLLQLKAFKETSPHLEKMVRVHLDDIAKKNYTRIAKSLDLPLDQVEAMVKKVLRLDPKPGRKYSNERTVQVVPDVRINEKGDSFEVLINRETMPELRISKAYRDMLKNPATDEATKKFIQEKIRNALELLRNLSRRKTTLRKVVEAIAEMQQEAILEGPACLKPLTFKAVAEKVGVHETTVCRAVSNKYADTPWGIAALKDFFPSCVKDSAGGSNSSSRIKMLIKELIDQEDKSRPLSDQDIVDALKGRQVEVSRRTVTKYREEAKIPSSVYRKVR